MNITTHPHFLYLLTKKTIKEFEEWARNRFKVLGYDKKKLPQSSMKLKNKVQDKSLNSQ